MEDNNNNNNNQKEICKEIFSDLNSIDLTGQTDKKLNLTYLSWAKAWGILKSHYPDATWTIYKRHEITKVTNTIVGQDGSTTVRETSYTTHVPYFTDGKTAWVEVGVTINGIEYTELLPVMGNHNEAVNIAMVDSVKVNKAIQRAFVKACARHGLGLYIYAGEDLPEDKRIDINKIIAAAQKEQYPNITEDQFNTLKADVISMVSNAQWSDSIQDVLVPYIQKSFDGLKLSQIQYGQHTIPLMRLNYVLSELNK